MAYGLPTGANITYGAAGFPDWVYQLGSTFKLKASTYPGHQEGSARRGRVRPESARTQPGQGMTSA